MLPTKRQPLSKPNAHFWNTREDWTGDVIRTQKPILQSGRGIVNQACIGFIKSPMEEAESTQGSGSHLRGGPMVVGRKAPVAWKQMASVPDCVSVDCANCATFPRIQFASR
jgi:hypothetical protein